MKRKNIILSTLLILLSVLGAVGQETKQPPSATAAPAAPDFRSGAVKTKAGYLLVWNEKGNYYTVEINGKDVKQTSQKDIFFSVDEKFLQILTLPQTDFLDPGQTGLNGKAILQTHRDWEVDYLTTVYKAGPLKVQSDWQKMPNGKDALLWQYEMPANFNQTVKKQMYLSVVKGDRLFMLNSVVTDKFDEKTTRELLVAVMSTLKPSDKPTDLLEIQNKMREGK